jgi:hypothetical protein
MNLWHLTQNQQIMMCWQLWKAHDNIYYYTKMQFFMQVK